MSFYCLNWLLIILSINNNNRKSFGQQQKTDSSPTVDVWLVTGLDRVEKLEMHFYWKASRRCRGFPRGRTTIHAVDSCGGNKLGGIDMWRKTGMTRQPTYTHGLMIPLGNNSRGTGNRVGLGIDWIGFSRNQIIARWHLTGCRRGLQLRWTGKEKEARRRIRRPFAFQFWFIGSGSTYLGIHLVHVRTL